MLVSRPRLALTAVGAACLVLSTLAVLTATPVGAAPGDLVLTVLHNNDGESRITAYACGTDPYASNVNLVAGDGKASAAAAFTPIDDQGHVCIGSYSTSDVVVDLTAVIGRV